MKKKVQGPKFEDCIGIIDDCLTKRRTKWNLCALRWMDYDDVSQIIRIHIYQKWSHYNPEKPLGPWVNAVITNQLRNLVRNNFTNYARPCLRCAAAEGEDGCKIYATQCSQCPLFLKWEKTRKNAYNIKVPQSLEDVSFSIKNVQESLPDIGLEAERFHIRMKDNLRPMEYKVYESLYINNESESLLAKKLGYKTSEKNRSPGYKQIKKIKKMILIKAKKLLEAGE